MMKMFKVGHKSTRPTRIGVVLLFLLLDLKTLFRDHLKTICTHVLEYYWILKYYCLTHCRLTTSKKMKFSIKDVSRKCNKLQIWSHLLQKSLMENFIFLCSECRNSAFPENFRKPLVFWCFQGVQKWNNNLI